MCDRLDDTEDTMFLITVSIVIVWVLGAIAYAMCLSTGVLK